MSVPREYSPQYVGRSFAKQYYNILSTNPAELYKFYLPDAQLLHAEDLMDTTIVTGATAIQERISQFNLFGSQINMSKGSIDAIRFDSTHILVVVTGVFTALGVVPRSFTQSFVLVGQHNSYFVSNSVFRLIPSAELPSVEKVEIQAVAPAAVATPTVAPPVALETVSSPSEPNVSEPVLAVALEEAEPIVKEVKEVEPLVEEIAVVPETTVPPSVTTKETKEHKESHHREKPKREKKDREAKKETKQETPSSPLSYVDIARRHTEEQAAAEEKKKEQTKSNANSTWTEDAAEKVELDVVKEVVTSSENDKVQEEKKDDTVHISGFAKEITLSQIQTIFGQFGAVKNVKLFKDFGFVTFIDANCAFDVLQKEVVTVDGHTFNVHKRSFKKKPFKKDFVKDKYTSEHKSKDGKESSNKEKEKSYFKKNKKSNDQKPSQDDA